MLLSLGARGNVITIVSWIAVILTVMIGVLWYGNHFSLDKVELEKTENDLSNMRKMVDDACQLNYYRAEYNPATETGSLTINDKNICIETGGMGRCKATICTLDVYRGNPKVIDLSKITNVVVTKIENGGVEFE